MTVTFIDTFNRANTAAGGAGSTNVTGPGGSYFSGAYVDIDGCGAVINTNQLNVPYVALANFRNAGLVTPGAVSILYVTGKVKYKYQSTNHSCSIKVRENAAGTSNYLAYINGGLLNIGAMLAGSYTGGPTGAVSPAPSVNDIIRIELTCAAGTSSGTKVTANAYNETTGGALIATCTVDNDATGNQSAGGVGTSSYFSTSVVTYLEGDDDGVAQSMSLNVNSGPVNGNTALVITGTGTSWVPGVTTASVTGGTGASLSSIVCVSATQITAALAAGSAAGTLVIHDSLDAATAPFTVNASAAVTNGAITITANDPTGVTLGLAPGGGAATITNTIYRHTAPFTPPGTGTSLGTATNGVTSFKDSTPPTLQPIYYRSIATDGTTSATSAQTASQGAIQARNRSIARKIGVIGDSIMVGYGSGNVSPVAFTVATLNANPDYLWTYNNQAVNGTSTSDWVNSTGGVTLSSVNASFNSSAIDTLIVALGMNDCRSPNNFSGATYQSNLTSLINTVLAAVTSITRVYVAEPTFPTPGTSGGQWSESSITLVEAYKASLANIASGNNKVKVIAKGAMEEFGQNAATLLNSSDVHPNTAGSTLLGNWYAADIRSLESTGTGGVTIYIQVE